MLIHQYLYDFAYAYVVCEFVTVLIVSIMAAAELCGNLWLQGSTQALCVCIYCMCIRLCVDILHIIHILCLLLCIRLLRYMHVYV